MKSIRLYLLLSLLATLTLVNFVALMHAYQNSMQKAEALIDEQLKNTAYLVAAASDEIGVDEGYIDSALNSYTYYQIISPSGRHVYKRSINAPDIVLSHVKEGFGESNFAQYRWRTYTFWDDLHAAWIVVAERVDVRYLLAEEVISSSLLPIVMAIPVSGCLIWLIVSFGLKPLRRFANAIRHKRTDDLSPIQMNHVPAEMHDAVANTNSLLRRLDQAFIREQQFSADAAHELRTPLSVLKVHLHNLKFRLGEDDPDWMSFNEGLERMQHLIEQLLTLYRTSPDQASATFELCDLNAMTQEVLATIYQHFEDKQQNLSLQSEHDTAWVDGNAFALDTMMKNLMLNAAKYTPEQGTINVFIDVDDSAVIWRVEDSGAGIPEAYYQRVFERFYRLHGDQHQSGQPGCGLGLTIVEHIVNLHHATITLGKSETLNGLSVSVRFNKSASNE